MHYIVKQSFTFTTNDLLVYHLINLARSSSSVHIFIKMVNALKLNL